MHPTTSSFLALCAAAAAAASAAEIVVTDGRGEPVRDASARVVGSERVVAADERGRLELELAAEAPACIVAPGRAPVLATAGVAAVTLQRAARVTGRVADGAGPVAGATVELEDDAWRTCVGAAVTNDGGRFVLDGIAPGRATLKASAPQHLPGSARFAALRPADRRAVEILLHRAVHVAGSVTRGRGEAVSPVAGALVRPVPEWDRLPLDPPLSRERREAIDEREVETTAEGRHDLGMLPWRAEWRIAVEAEGFPVTSVRVDGRAAEARADVHLAPGAHVRLRTVDDAGAPWPRPSVRLFDDGVPDADLQPEPEPGGEDGRLELGPLPAGTWSVEVTAPGARPRTLRGLLLDQGRSRDLGDVVLQPGARVGGTALDQDDIPIAGVEVTLRAHVGGRRLARETTTDDEGRFLFDGLEPGVRSEVRASADGHLSARARDVEPDTLDLVLRLERAGTLEGTVVDAETGEPVPAFWVRPTPVTPGLRWARGADGRDGAFRLDPVALGEWSLQVGSAAHAPRTVEPVLVDATDEPTVVEVALERGWELEGLTVTADGGVLARARVTAFMPETGARQEVRSGLDGRFALQGLSGPVDVEAHHERFQPARRLQVEAGAEDLTLVLEPGGRIEGRVLDGRGRPSPGSTVRVDGLRLKSTSADAAGRYALEGLPAGRHVVTKVDDPQTLRGFEQATVEVAIGETTVQDFGGGRRVHGTVTYRGEPATGAVVTVTSTPVVTDGQGMDRADFVGRTATVGEDGTYVVSNVSAGLSALHVHWQDRRFGREIALREDEWEQRVDLVVPELVVAGVVVDAETGDPIPGVGVGARPTLPDVGEGAYRSGMSMSRSTEEGLLELSSTVSSKATSHADGRFELLLDAPGEYTVWAYREGWDSASRKLAVEEPVLDLVLELAQVAEKGTVRVRARDRVSGAPLNGFEAAFLTERSVMTHGGPMNVTQQEFLAGDEVTVVLGKAGVAPGIVKGIEVPEGGVEDVVVDMGGGGDLLLRVPPEQVTKDTTFHFLSGLRLVDAEGFDLLSRCSHLAGANAVQLDEETWLLAHVPSGTWSVGLTGGEGEPAIVEVLDGQETAVDLR